MQISEHYVNYPKRTLIVLTNNELAKLLLVNDREVDEIALLKVDTEIPEERSSGTANSAPPDIDEIKRHSRMELYKQLSDKLMKSRKDVEEIILCAPEANKNELLDAMHTDIQQLVKEVVPKNLASLPLDQVVRILQESRP